MKFYLTLAGICVALSGLFSQRGTPSAPYTSIAQARAVTTTGIYYFHIGQEVFSTRVIPGGYVQVATDYGNGVGALPATRNLSSAVRGILEPKILAKFSSGIRVAITTSDGSIAAYSVNLNLVQRVATNTTLMNGGGDNENNADWVGTGEAFLEVDASCQSSPRPLPEEVFHTCGDGAGVTWFPARNDQAITFNGGNIADNQYFALYVLGPAPPTPPVWGSAANPYTSIRQARNVTAAGVKFFDLGGTKFSTLVSAQGDIQVAVDYGNGVGRLPQSTALDGSARGILPPAVLAKLTAANRVRITSSVPGTLDAVSTNATYLNRIRSNQTLMYDNEDNLLNDSWTGTGENLLKVESTTDRPNPRPLLSDEVYHTFGNGAGVTWFPARNDQAINFNQGNIADNEKLTLFVRGNPTVACNITMQPPAVIDERCPGENDGRITVSTSCAECNTSLEYSRDAVTYQTSNVFANLSPGTYYIYVRERGGNTCSQRVVATVAQGIDTGLPALPALAPLTLTTCKGGPQTVAAPTVQDDCAGTITATTGDATTFSASGDYTIRWTFNDGNGNTASKTQQVKVYGPVLSLPYTEGFEAVSPTKACWAPVDINGGSAWRELTQQNVAHSGQSFYVLLIDEANGHNDQLHGPVFAATGGTEYNLAYAYRTYGNGPAGQMRVVLVDAAARAIVKTLSTGTDDSNLYREMNLRFDVPQTGTYFIAFLVTTPAGGKGILLDDITIKADTGPVNGASGLVGNGDNACSTLEGYDLNGFAFNRFVDATGKLAMEIDPNGNDLGDVTVKMTDYSASPIAPFLGQRVLSRHFDVSPSNGSGPYDANGGVKVRLYFTTAELSQLSAVSGEQLEWEDMIVYHYSDENQDCIIENSTGNDVSFIDSEDITAFDGTAYALTFTVNSFSEFGGTTNAAASGLPVTLRSFIAMDEAVSNRLEWQVDQEIDFSHYSLERSTDGIAFSELVSVEGLQKNVYSAIDPAPAPLTYYRLKMIDLDGSFEYGDVVSVSRDGRTPFAITTAFPIPTHDLLTLRFTARTEGPVKLRLADGLGRIVQHGLINSRAGLNEELLDLSNLPVGSYHLMLNDGKEIRTVRVIKH